MTQSELEAMLKESDLMSYGLGKDGFKFFSACDSFAKLIAAKEQEAIIDLVAFYGGPVDLEAAIRARGEA